jgi:hypothetical protein
MNQSTRLLPVISGSGHRGSGHAGCAGERPHGVLVTMYFDKKRNLLARLIRFSNTPLRRRRQSRH